MKEVVSSDIVFRAGAFAVREWGVGECREYTVCGIRDDNRFAYICKDRERSRAVHIAIHLYNMRNERRETACAK